MASIDEMMSHKNKDPKWITESSGKGGNNNNDNSSSKNNNNNKNDKELSIPASKPKAPSVPKTEFKVKMCCEKCEEKAKEEAGEVKGVVSVTTDKSKSKVTVTGYADAAAVLKKLKKHVNRKASYWPTTDSNPNKKQVAFKEADSGGLGDGKLQGDHKGGKQLGDIKGGKQLGDIKGGKQLGDIKGKGEKGEKGEKDEKSSYEKSEKMGDQKSKINNDNNMEHDSGETKKGSNKKGSNVSGDRDFQGPNKPLLQGPQQNGYMPADPRQFQAVDPWTAGGAGGGGGYGGPQYYESHAVDPRDLMRGAGDYQPMPLYFSNYRPSQSYPANYSYIDEYSNQPITNPNYIKQVYY
jgi:copper chaperone CopZ